MSDPDVGAALTAHLRSWVGQWPPPASGPALHVVAHPGRALPGWDGDAYPATGVVRADGRGVLGVDPDAAPLLHDGDIEAVLASLPAAFGGGGGTAVRGAFRWTTAPATAAELPDVGEWLPITDPRVPQWLQPFGGEVLVALDDDTYVAGVGLKKHDDHARELAVVTSEQARGRGLARRLVAQAARRVLDEGRVPTYLHGLDNEASARVVAVSGFPDVGWQVLGYRP